MQTTSTLTSASACLSAPVSFSFRIPDAPKRFFASKADYRDYRLAWRQLLASKAPLGPEHFAAHALLTGGDLFKAFSRNGRGHGQAPYGALERALETIHHPHAPTAAAWVATGYRFADRLPALRDALTAAGLERCSRGMQALGRGNFGGIASAAAMTSEA